jgi:hypothetical protein
VGHSGCGKSTAARQRAPEKNIRILSDDRIILREREGKIWMYSTPWHGDAGSASPDCVPVTRIFSLEQSKRNELVDQNLAQATAALLARSFVPFHSPGQPNFALGFLERVTQQIRCQIFRFRPDPSAVEAIRSGELREKELTAIRSPV